MASARTSLADLKPKPRNDAYTVLLSLSLAAMIGACALLWYDLKQYPSVRPAPGDTNPVQIQQQPVEPAPEPMGDPMGREAARAAQPARPAPPPMP